MTTPKPDLNQVKPEPDLRLGLTIYPQRGPRIWIRRKAYALEDRGGHPFLAPTSTRPTRVELPVEILPKVVEVDLDSPDAILGFVNEYGPLKAWPTGFAQMAIGDRSAARPSAVRPTPAVRQLVRWRSRWAMNDDDQRYGEFVDEFRVGAAGLQALVLLRQELEAEQFSYARLEKDWSPSCPWSNRWLSTKKKTWPVVLMLINAGLKSCDVTVAVPVLGKRIDVNALDSLGLAAGEALSLQVNGPFSLYGVGVLELAQHILEGREYRNCANELCGRLFSMQEGRSRSGRHRTDVVKYCSRKCALAQAQREHRRRQAIASPL